MTALNWFQLFAFILLSFFAWQLYRAKQFNQFKGYIQNELKPQLIAKIIAELNAERCEKFPNTQAHINASIYFWTLSSARILQAALEKELIDKDWLKATGNYRHCQHLFFIERNTLVPRNLPTDTSE